MSDWRVEQITPLPKGATQYLLSHPEYENIRVREHQHFRTYVWDGWDGPVEHTYCIEINAAIHRHLRNQ